MNVWWKNEMAESRRDRRRERHWWQRHNTLENKVGYNKTSAIAKKINLTSKRNSWKNFVSTINVNNPSTTVWNNFKAMEDFSYKRFKYIMDGNGRYLSGKKKDC